MKHLKKILTMFITIAILCSASIGVHGEGVVFRNESLIDDNSYAQLNEWLINTPYWAVDIFAPGYSTRHLKNDPSGNDKTIDFEITPYNGIKSTVIVSDIPEEYRDVYNEFINDEKKVDPHATLEVSNVIRRNGSLILDYTASGKFEVSYDRFGDPEFKYFVNLYGITSNKQTGEIIRYDLICPLVFDSSYYFHPYVPGNTDMFDDYLPNVKRAKINFPSDFDPEKHEYAFCFLAYTPYIDNIETLAFGRFLYQGDIKLFNYTKVDIPTTINILGDVDGNGIVNTSDLSLFERCLSGGSDKLNINADVNDDGEITTVDYNTLRRQLAYGSHQ